MDGSTDTSPWPGRARPARRIAQLIKANVGLEVAFTDAGGWGTHVNLGNATGQLATRLRDFGNSIAALVADFGDRMGNVLILTMSDGFKLGVSSPLQG